jgi:hypothetical protein
VRPRPQLAPQLRLAAPPLQPSPPRRSRCPASCRRPLLSCRQDLSRRYSPRQPLSFSLQIWVQPLPGRRRLDPGGRPMSTRSLRRLLSCSVLQLNKGHLGPRPPVSMRRVGGAASLAPSLRPQLLRRPCHHLKLQVRAGRGSRWRCRDGRQLSRAAWLCHQSGAHSWQASGLLLRQPGCSGDVSVASSRVDAGIGPVNAVTQ